MHRKGSTMRARAWATVSVAAVLMTVTAGSAPLHVGAAAASGASAAPAAGCAGETTFGITRTPQAALSPHGAWHASTAVPGCRAAAPPPAGGAPAAAAPPLGSSSVIDTVAGGGIGEGGPALQAEFFLPGAEAFDGAGNLYVTTIGRVQTLSPTGVPGTFAGTGTVGFGAYDSYLGDGGDRLGANFGNGGPANIAFDGHGNAYIADIGNDVVRKIDSHGVVSTFAGSGQIGSYGVEGASPTSVYLWAPDGIAVDGSGDVFIADSGWCTIQEVKASDGKIYTYAGIPPGNPLVTNATCGYTADGVPALGSRLNSPKDIKFDSKGNLILADIGNCRIRSISPLGIISTIAGNDAVDSKGYCVDSGDGGAAASAGIAYPWHVALDGSDDLYVAEYFNHVIRKITASGTVTTFAGTEGSDGFSGDGGPATKARLDYPLGVAVAPDGAVDIADFGNNRIRQVDAGGTIHTIAGNGLPPWSCNGSLCGYWGDGYSGDGLPARHATLSSPYSVAVDSGGNIYVADNGNGRLREVDASSGVIRTIAGTGTPGETGTGGPAAGAAVSPLSLAIGPSGQLYLGEYSHIRTIDGAGIIHSVAGGGTSLGDGGAATAAQLNGVTGMAFDSAGNLYFSDGGDHRVRRIDTSGVVTTVAGNGTKGFAGDGGPATAAELASPVGIALDSHGDLFIADSANNRIRRVDASGVITTVAGDASSGWSGDGGAATSTALEHPVGVAADAGGDVLESEPANCVIREIDASTGAIHVIAGTPPAYNATSPLLLNCDFGGDGGPAGSAHLFLPWTLFRTAAGALYFADVSNNRIRVIGAAAPAQVPDAPLAPLLIVLGAAPLLAVRRLGGTPAPPGWRAGAGRRRSGGCHTEPRASRSG